MGLFKPKHSYVKLDVPSLNSFLLPDMRVMQKDAAVVQQIVKVALKNLDNTCGDVQHSLPAVATLEGQLLRLFAQGDEERARELAPAVFMGTRAGYWMGVLENNSGVARHDGCETHYWTALIIMKMQLTKDLPNDIALQADYCFSAGYYLGRKGDLAIGAIVGSLQSQMKAA